MLLHTYTDEISCGFPQAAEAVSSKFKPPNKLEFEKVQPPYPAPCTLHSAPCTLQPAPCTLHPTP